MSSTDRSEFMSHPALFKWKHFQPEIILLNVRWYCRYALSYRDLLSFSHIYCNKERIAKRCDFRKLWP